MKISLGLSNILFRKSSDKDTLLVNMTDYDCVIVIVRSLLTVGYAPDGEEALPTAPPTEQPCQQTTNIQSTSLLTVNKNLCNKFLHPAVSQGRIWM